MGECLDMKISIAMAVYNGEKFISQQIESILCQLNADDELVISYDNSSDNTLNIINSIKDCDQRVKVYVNKNPGVFGNFDNAISKTTGDIIFISDQDDVWDRNKVETVLSHFNDDVDIVIHNGVHIDENGCVISKNFFELYNIKKSIVKNFIKPRYSGCCMAFKNELKKKILPIPLDVGAYDHWIGMVGELFYKVCFINDVLIYHRIHNNNVTPTSRRRLSSIIKYRLFLLIQLFKRRHCNV